MAPNLECGSLMLNAPLLTSYHPNKMMGLVFYVEFEKCIHKHLNTVVVNVSAYALLYFYFPGFLILCCDWVFFFFFWGGMQTDQF